MFCYCFGLGQTVRNSGSTRHEIDYSYDLSLSQYCVNIIDLIDKVITPSSNNVISFMFLLVIGRRST